MSKPFSRRRWQGMAGEVAGVIRLSFAAGEISSWLGLEGTMRAALRADLCLRGWQWRDANQAACDIVAHAHSLLGAERPSWYEGQPEYILAPGVLIERTRCRRCRKKLPEERPTFCSDICRRGHHTMLARIRAEADGEAADLAIRSIW